MSPLDRIQRREFLLQGSVAAAVGVAALTTAQADDKKKKDSLSPKVFEKFVGEEFTIIKESKEHGRQTATFVLREVKSHKHASDKRRPTQVRKEGFSLLFDPKTGSKLEDGIYQVQHDKLGKYTLFLSRTVRDDKKDRVHFVAVFN